MQDEIWLMFEDLYVYNIQGTRIMFLKDGVVYSFNALIGERKLTDFIVSAPRFNMKEQLDNLNHFLTN
jgi:hypothetical protein